MSARSILSRCATPATRIQPKEITQAVFVILARKSRHLGRRVILSGWLYKTARLTALTHIRSEMRRAHREQEVHLQTDLNENESNAWTQIAPLVDEAIASLNDTDRNAVVLRFFDGKSLREVGAALGANENAARMRVDRALEKLRLFLTKRGVSSTAAIIAAAISANSVQAAPEALAKVVSGVALAHGAAASNSTLALIKGALKVTAWIKVKTGIAAGVGVLLVATTTTVMVMQGQDTTSGQRKGMTLNPYPPAGPQALAELENKVKERQGIKETSKEITINLKPYINCKLTDPLADMPDQKEHTLEALPAGLHVYGGVPFDVQGTIQLDGPSVQKGIKVWPVAVTNIAIGHSFKKLHLLNGAFNIKTHALHNPYATLILHYADGSKTALALAGGIQALRCVDAAIPQELDMLKAPQTELGWMGSNPYLKKHNPSASLHLYRTTFDNPKPEAQVTTVDYISSMITPGPFMVGLTVE